MTIPAVNDPVATTQAVTARGLTHRYGERVALRDVGFRVERGTKYAFLGPNGSGKSTLFKLLATILPVQQGDLWAMGVDVTRAPASLRAQLGVVFQSPAIDRKLTVRQNLLYGGRMFGLSGRRLDDRVAEVMARTQLAERAGDKVETLSGGLRRRVELAKCLLHQPALLVLDEPTTGLDPTARRDLWSLLSGFEGSTVMFTTHLLDEAEAADRVLILHAGEVVAEGTPAELSRSVGGEALEVSVDPEQADAVRAELQERFQIEAKAFDGTLRAQVADAHRLVAAVVDALGERARRVAVSPPSLLDVYFLKTGAPFAAAGDGDGDRDGKRQPASRRRR
ncbi:MAG: ABC transporter ATP-binding protein [Planctomycetota bacterium]